MHCVYDGSFAWVQSLVVAKAGDDIIYRKRVSCLINAQLTSLFSAVSIYHLLHFFSIDV